MCAYLAIKVLVSLWFIKCLSVLALALFSSTYSASWACFAVILVSIMSSLTRHPLILLISIWNFGPLRNTVGLYIENLPDHIYSSITAPLHRWKENLKQAVANRDDQRIIVGSGDDSDSFCSDDEGHCHKRRGR